MSTSSSSTDKQISKSKELLSNISSYVPPLHDQKSPLSIWRSVKGQYPAADMPEYPARILLEHCLWKGLQWSVLAPIIWPIYSIVRKQALTTTYRPVFITTPLIGVLATGGLLGYKAAFEMDSEGVDDRGYRIHKSVSQNHVDQYSLYGSLIGASTGAIFGKHGFSSVLAASSVGIAMGVYIHIYPLIEDELIPKVRNLFH